MLARNAACATKGTALLAGLHDLVGCPVHSAFPRLQARYLHVTQRVGKQRVGVRDADCMYSEYDEDVYDESEADTVEITRPDGHVLSFPNDGKLRCDVCGRICKNEQALEKHDHIHIRERNKRSGRGNGKKPNQKPRRNGNHALLPPR